MEVCDFVYHRPSSRADACALGLRHGKAARFLAGGTELLPDLKQHRDETQHLIDLNGIDGLRQIDHDGARIRIGCLATLSEIAESATIRESIPALSEAILTMAAPQIRNRGTLAGNFCGGVPSADTPPICIALNATLRIAGTEGERMIAAEAFAFAPRRVDLRPGEIMIEVQIPVPPAGTGARYERFALRRSTALPVVGVAASLRMEGPEIREGRVVLGAVAPIPLLAIRTMELLTGRAADETLFAQAAALAVQEARPISDLRGSADFRRELVRVLTLRALRGAAERARVPAGSGGVR